MGPVPQWAMLETIRNIGEHVIPYLRTGPGAEIIEQRRTATV